MNRRVRKRYPPLLLPSTPLVEGRGKSSRGSWVQSAKILAFGEFSPRALGRRGKISLPPRGTSGGREQGRGAAIGVEVSSSWPMSTAGGRQRNTSSPRPSPPLRGREGEDSVSWDRFRA